MIRPSFTQYRPPIEVADLLERGHRLFICDGCGALAVRCEEGDRHLDGGSPVSEHDAEVIPLP